MRSAIEWFESRVHIYRLIVWSRVHVVPVVDFGSRVVLAGRLAEHLNISACLAVVPVLVVHFGSRVETRLLAKDLKIAKGPAVKVKVGQGHWQAKRTWTSPPVFE